MSQQLAIAVTFDEQLQPYSDAEGLVPSRVENAGVTRKSTLVNEERSTVYERLMRMKSRKKRLLLSRTIL